MIFVNDLLEWFLVQKGNCNYTKNNNITRANYNKTYFGQREVRDLFKIRMWNNSDFPTLGTPTRDARKRGHHELTPMKLARPSKAGDGIENIGQTCYMNAFVQTMLAIQHVLCGEGMKYPFVRLCSEFRDGKYSSTEMAHKLIPFYRKHNFHPNSQSCFFEVYSLMCSDYDECYTSYAESWRKVK